MKKMVILMLAVVFLMTCSLALAADKWVVIKDKNGVCKVIKAKDKTPATIAGPFNTEKEADAAKEKECPKADQPKVDPKKEPAKADPKKEPAKK